MKNHYENRIVFHSQNDESSKIWNLKNWFMRISCWRMIINVWKGFLIIIAVILPSHFQQTRRKVAPKMPVPPMITKIITIMWENPESQQMPKTEGRAPEIKKEDRQDTVGRHWRKRLWKKKKEGQVYPSGKKHWSRIRELCSMLCTRSFCWRYCHRSSHLRRWKWKISDTAGIRIRSNLRI